jgi:hypothetical protein
MSGAEKVPEVDEHGVPRCTYDDCPSYDGKRCEETGFRPGSICEPAVIDMVEEIRAIRVLRREQGR